MHIPIAFRQSTQLTAYFNTCTIIIYLGPGGQQCMYSHHNCIHIYTQAYLFYAAEFLEYLPVASLVHMHAFMLTMQSQLSVIIRIY